MSKWPTVDERMNMSSKELEDLRTNEINKIMANTKNESAYLKLRRLQADIDERVTKSREIGASPLQVASMLIGVMNVSKDKLEAFDEVIQLDTYKEQLTNVLEKVNKLNADLNK
tara:strand:+ start:901 stop:1242 length:342 start_codon:yes stop_codon:yes gene_type:complete